MALSNEQRNNYAYFQQELPSLLSDPLKTGKFAIISDLTVKGLFDTFETAYREACIKFADDFIVQQIIDERKIVNYLSPAVAQ